MSNGMSGGARHEISEQSSTPRGTASVVVHVELPNHFAAPRAWAGAPGSGFGNPRSRPAVRVYKPHDGRSDDKAEGKAGQ